MIETIQLSPGVTLRCFKDCRFKQGRITLQLVRPMCREEVAMNALLPAVLLRGTARHPDFRSITMHLDDLYGAGVGDLVRRIGDYQTLGFYCSFTEDRFAMEGDRILAPVVDFLGELLLQPLTEGDCFCAQTVHREKDTRIREIEAIFDDKPLYAVDSLMRLMCPGDSFGIPRLGDADQVAAITPEALYTHYQRLLRESPVEIFYVGGAEAEEVAALFRPLFQNIPRKVAALPHQKPFQNAGHQQICQESATNQSILTMSYVTPITHHSPEYAAMRVLNMILGAGMTSKLFMNIREKMSLCYSIGTEYYGAKGIVTVSAGIDADREQIVRQEIGVQLSACVDGEISDEELQAAKEALLSSLRSLHDAPGSIENYYSMQALGGSALDPAQYRAAIEKVTVSDVARAAQTLQEHSAFFLKGVGQ